MVLGYNRECQMKPSALAKMIFSYDAGWKELVDIHPTVGKMFFFYVVPMSLLPPAMFYYAGMRYGSVMLPHISSNQLLLIVAVFYVAELVTVPLVALAIQRLGDVVSASPAYADAFILAAVAPTPLWLAPVCLFIPSVLINAFVGAFAMLGAWGLIYHGVYRVFNLEDKGQSLLMAGSVLAVGLVAWVALMVLTLVVWGYA